MIRSASVSMLVVIVAASVLIGVLRGQQRPAANEFADKVVTVYLSDGQQMQGGLVLENVEIREIAGRTFLVGIGTDTSQEGNPAQGVEVGVAWESVAVYFAMTREQFRDKLEEGR